MSTTDKRTLIDDKKLAIAMLCQTNKVWDRLSTELKNDPEVILYYQPTGYMMEIGTLDRDDAVKKIILLGIK